MDHGPLEADGHHGGQRRLERLGVSRRLVEVPAPVEGERRARNDVVADLSGQPDDQVLARGRPDEDSGWTA